MDERDTSDNYSAKDKDEELVLVDEQTDETPAEKQKAEDAAALQALNNKYLRLYAEFDN